MPQRLLKPDWWKSHVAIVGLFMAGAYILIGITVLLYGGVNNKANNNTDIIAGLRQSDTHLCHTVQRIQLKQYVFQKTQQEAFSSHAQLEKIARAFGLTIPQLKKLQRAQLAGLKPESCRQILG